MGGRASLIDGPRSEHHEQIIPGGYGTSTTPSIATPCSHFCLKGDCASAISIAPARNRVYRFRSSRRRRRYLQLNYGPDTAIPRAIAAFGYAPPCRSPVLDSSARRVARLQPTDGFDGSPAVCSNLPACGSITIRKGDWTTRFAECAGGQSQDLGGLTVSSEYGTLKSPFAILTFSVGRDVDLFERRDGVDAVTRRYVMLRWKRPLPRAVGRGYALYPAMTLNTKCWRRAGHSPHAVFVSAVLCACTLPRPC